MKKKIVVAMSGGVDSSVAALLLMKQGYDVTGLSLKLFEQSKCCGVRGIEDARGVARKLGIPFYAINCVKEFEKKIIDYFCKSYKDGITPNPCVLCNGLIKFGYLLKKAGELGIGHIATGHYARTAKKNGRWFLKKGKDAGKDQSYFLYPLTREQLSVSVFPLGGYTKSAVRKLARENGLKVHDKPGSQEVCFIPGDDYRKFLEKRGYKGRPGPVVDKDNNLLGEHRGIAFYTIGQRGGLGISHKTPLYVTSIDSKKNIIVVGTNKETFTDELVARDVNWAINPGEVKTGLSRGGMKVKARIRYRHEPASAALWKLGNGRVRVRFLKPQRSVTPGQSVVFYKRDVVVGGGIISNELV